MITVCTGSNYSLHSITLRCYSIIHTSIFTNHAISKKLCDNLLILISVFYSFIPLKLGRSQQIIQAFHLTLYDLSYDSTYFEII